MRVFIDFETYYDSEYSLKKMPTAQYVRDKRFKILGASVALEQNPPRWLEPEPLSAFIRAVPWDRVTLVAHNAAFDGLILSEKFDVHPSRQECTMLMARYMIAQGLLDPELTTSLAVLAPLVGKNKGDLDSALASGDLESYANLDLLICQGLHKLFFPQVPDNEMEHIDTHIRCATRPLFNLDVRTLEALRDKDQRMEKLFPLVRNDAAFAEALQRYGVTPEYKPTKKGGYKLAVAKTDDWMKGLESHPEPAVRLLVEVRRKAASTIERSRAQRFLDVGAPLPAPLLYYAAHTGRSGGQDKLNVQNLPRKEGLRQAIIAPDGHSFVIVDSSQIEVRVSAWDAGEDALVQQFRDGKDPYCAFAKTLYDRDYDDIRAAVKAEDPEAKAQRQVCKAAVLALGFGQGANGFLEYCKQFGIPMTAEESARVVSAYRRTFKRIVRRWREVEDIVRRTGETVLASGRKIVYPDLCDGAEGLEFKRAAIFRKIKTEGPTNLWHGKLIENLVQATARDVVFDQTARLKRQGWPIALMVHDEAVLVVPDARTEEAKEACRVAFGSTPRWAPGLPVAGEVHISKCYIK